MLKWVVTLILLGMLSACNIVYRAPIQQGNILTQSTIAQLKLGMTEEQVRYLLGSPVLQSPFQSNRWPYVYYYLPGHGEASQKHLLLIFSQHKLAHIEQ